MTVSSIRMCSCVLAASIAASMGVRVEAQMQAILAQWVQKLQNGCHMHLGNECVLHV